MRADLTAGRAQFRIPAKNAIIVKGHILKQNKILSAAVIIINIIGCVCLAVLSVPYLAHDTSVRYPDAMLPMESWDRAGMALTAGLFPLLAANCMAFVRLRKAMRKSPLRLLLFVPGVICFGMVVSYFATSLT